MRDLRLLFFPEIALTGIESPSSTTTDLIVGELVVGETSGAVAVYAEQRGSTQIYLIYKTQQTFQVSETVRFKESGVSAVVGVVAAQRGHPLHIITH